MVHRCFLNKVVDHECRTKVVDHECRTKAVDHECPPYGHLTVVPAAIPVTPEPMV